MTELQKRIKEEVKKNAIGRKKYPDKLKIDIMAHVEKKRRAGIPAVQTAKELGVSIQTINGWTYAAKKKGNTRPGKPGPKPGSKRKYTARLPNHKAKTVINAKVPGGEFTYTDGTLIIKGSAAKTVLIELLNGLS